MPRPTLTHRQFLVLDVFVRFQHRQVHKRPTFGDIRKKLGITSRSGVYYGHILPLLHKGFLDRDLPAFEKRGYFITTRGRKAHLDWKRSHVTETNAVDGRNRQGGEVPQELAAPESTERAA